MTLRKKTLIAISLTMVCLMLVLYFSLRSTVLTNFNTIDKDYTINHMQQVRNDIYRQIFNLDILNEQYASWDDTYQFIHNPQQSYIDVNLSNENLSQLEVNLVVLLTDSGEVVYQKGIDLKTNQEVPIPKLLRNDIFTKQEHLRVLNPKDSRAGIVMLPKGPLLLSAQPILTSDFKGPIAGTIIMGKYLDLANIKLITEHPLSSDLKADEILVKPISADYNVGYTKLKDFFGEQNLILEVEAPRTAYQQGKASLVYYLSALLVTSIVYCIVILLLLEKLVLSRLTKLIESIVSIGAYNSFSKRLTITGKDELAKLADSVNGMLGRLKTYNREIEDSEERYRRLVELTPDAIGVLTGETIVFMNSAGAKIIGAKKINDVIGKTINEVFHPAFISIARRRINEMRAKGEETARFEGQIVRLDGVAVDVEIAAVPVVYEGKEGLQIICRDITERKLAEKELRYLSLYDSLTGIYNRAYFEAEMSRLDKGRSNKMGLIICDVDGLKLVNDTLGHKVGDDLLLAAAEVIKHCFRTEDTVARIGGDEFAILMTGNNTLYIEEAAQRVRDAVQRYNQAHPKLPLSISVGFAVKDDPAVSRTDLFKEADNNMYREKLHRSRSARSAIVQALMKALEARDYITEGHGDRLQDLVVELATAFGLPSYKMPDLRLLAQFHDIGKVGIPDRILFKPGPLTPEEKKEMQRHSEIGHRIAQSASELVPIADWILKHHEWWNGSGYPLGLKGEEIPLECRILAIADAYDAMSNDRPYRKALTRQQIIDELNRCSGSQFDPKMVAIMVELMADNDYMEL